MKGQTTAPGLPASPPAPVIVLFVDGLGIGEPDPSSNPLAAFQPRVLRLCRDALGPFPRAGRCLEVDPRLGVEGLPQSATGQTALVTGINAASRLGKHVQGFPNRALRGLIAASSLFESLKQEGFRVTFANSYTPEFFRNRPRWVSVTTVMCESAGVELRTLEDLRAGRALFMDYTNRLLRRRGHDVPLQTPGDAARVLADLARDFDLCLYEYFLTDLVGHRGDMEAAVALLRDLDAFLFELISALDLDVVSLLVTSDHGNVECMDRKQHSLNRVPALLWGPLAAGAGSRELVSLTDIAPFLIRYLRQARREVP